MTSSRARFTEMSRLHRPSFLGNLISRRQVQQGLLGLPLVALYETLGVQHEATEAKKRKKKKTKCKKGLRCGKLCVDSLSDPQHCGGCGKACGSGQACCGGTCASLRNDWHNCGSCGHTCPNQESCIEGLCRCEGGILCDGACAIGGVCCEAEDCEPEACRSTNCTNNQCGYDLEPDGASCSDGLCCLATCVDVSSDQEHCGSCFHPCRNGDVCVDGTCGAVCDVTVFCEADGPTPDCCGGACTNTATDVDNCGACGQACDAGQRCWDGQCVCGDVCASGCQFTSIQSALGGLPSGTVRICAGTYHEWLGLGGDVTLIGAGDGPNGTVIDLSTGVTNSNGSTVFLFNHANVTLRGLRITGAFLRGVDVGFDCQLTMQHCTVIGNGTGQVGGSGGIKANGNLDISDSVIRDNTGQYGAGIVLGNLSTMTVRDSAIIENTALTDGGGIYISNGTATLTNCVVEGNTARSAAGVWVETSSALHLVNSAIINNIASVAAGGIYNDGGDVTLDAESSVSDNEPDDCVGTPACSP